jgi:hypothetical protein
MTAQMPLMRRIFAVLFRELWEELIRGIRRIRGICAFLRRSGRPERMCDERGVRAIFPS